MGSDKFKVAVLGAAGGIGQPLALLLKMNPMVGALSLYDVVATPGVGADLGHINTGAKVEAFEGSFEAAEQKVQLAKALQGVQLVIIPAGVPRKPGMTRDDLFKINAGIVAGLADGIAEHCPTAWVAVISNPVNSTVPIFAEVFKKAGTYNPAKLLGVTKLDVVRAQTFVGAIVGVDPQEVHVPVVGGHAGVTILPILSQAKPAMNSLSTEAAAKLTERIQNAGTEVVDAKAGKGSATLSMAYAAAVFAESCLKAMSGEANVRDYAYVESSVTDLPFFASRVLLGKEGVEEVEGLGSLNAAEAAGLEALKSELLGSIQKGIDFVASRA